MQSPQGVKELIKNLNRCDIKRQVLDDLEREREKQRQGIGQSLRKCSAKCQVKLREGADNDKNSPLAVAENGSTDVKKEKKKNKKEKDKPELLSSLGEQVKARAIDVK